MVTYNIAVYFRDTLQRQDSRKRYDAAALKTRNFLYDIIAANGGLDTHGGHHANDTLHAFLCAKCKCFSIPYRDYTLTFCAQS